MRPEFTLKFDKCWDMVQQYCSEFNILNPFYVFMDLDLCMSSSPELKKFMNEPDLNIVKQVFEKLGKKYIFECDIYMKGCYKKLYEQHQSVIIKSKSPVTDFLHDKIFPDKYAIYKEIIKKYINILSHDDPSNFYVLDNDFVIICKHCGKDGCEKYKNTFKYNQNICMNCNSQFNPSFRFETNKIYENNDAMKNIEIYNPLHILYNLRVNMHNMTISYVGIGSVNRCYILAEMIKNTDV